MKTVLFINLRKTAQEAYSALLAAKQLDFNIILVGDKFYEIANAFVAHQEIVNTYDHDITIETIKQLSKKFKIDGIVTWADRDVELVAHGAEVLNLPAPSRKAAYTARNKHAMLEVLTPLSDILPAYKKVTTIESLEEAIGHVGFPAVMKPTGASGSKGIFVVSNEKEAKNAFEKLQTITSPNSDPIFKFYGSELLFEEYLDGNEFSVEGWVYNGEITIAAITDKLTTEPFHLEYQHIQPSCMAIDQQGVIKKNTNKILQQMQLNHCAFHLEAKWTSKGFKFIEVAARPGGDYIASHLFPLSTNINFLEQIIKIAVGQKPENIIPTYQYAAARFLLANTEGQFKQISGVDQLLSNDFIRSVFLEAKIDQNISLPPNNFATQRVASFITSAPTYSLVQDMINKTINNTEVVMA